MAGLSVPHAVQAIRVTRRVRYLASRRWRAVTVYAVTSLTAIKAALRQLAGYLRGHWAIENQLYWVRDVTFAEDASQVRVGTAPRAIPSLASLPYETDITPQRRGPLRPAGLDGRQTTRVHSTPVRQLGIALRVRSGLDFGGGADDPIGRARSRS